MSDEAMKRHVFEGVVAINALVENCSFEDAHHGIKILREHLEARAAQTRPIDNFTDLLGV